jgi:hypothetical protein
VGQKDKGTPFSPVPETKQKWAMTLLNKYVFAPNAFETPEGIFDYLQLERRGFSGTYDPKIHDQFLSIQKGILDHLLHIKVTKRISDTEMYGNSYSLMAMMSDLTKACFSADNHSNVNSTRRNLQIEYTERLIRIVQNKGKAKYDNLIISYAFDNLKTIEKYSSKTQGLDEATKAHRRYLTYRINKSLDLL